MNKRNLIIDAHCDTIKEALDDNLSICNGRYSFNFCDIKEKLPYIQFMASFVNPNCLLSAAKGGYSRVNNIIDKFYRMYDKYSDFVVLIRSNNDLNRIIEEKKLGVVLSIENGSAIAGDLKNIDRLYNRGVRVMSVTWNDDNDLGCGCSTSNDLGLTELGKEYVSILDNRGILVDVSHLSYNSFYDVVKICKLPIIATHSCVKSICDHNRNLTDDQIKEIAKSGGVIGICYHSRFLTKKDTCTSDDIVDHIEYIAKLVGIDYVGLGSDFDGIDKKDLPEDLKGVKDVDIIFDKMKERNFTDEQIEKVSSKNFMRVLKSIL